MRSPADAALVAREPNLPGLALALDADALQRLVVERAGFNIDRVEVCYLRYQPQTKCLAALRIKAGDEVRWAYLKCYHRADAARWSKVAARGDSASGAGTGRIVWPELATELIWFPTDDRIDHLGQLFDEAYRAALLTRICPALPELTGGRLATLNYKPERRFVGALADDGTTHAVVKIYTASSFPAALLRARALRDAPWSLGPRLIGRSKRRNLLVFRWQSGDVLADHLEAADAPALGASTGRMLAQLHGTRGLALPVRTWLDELAAWDAARNFLTWVMPSSGRQLAELDQCLRATPFDEGAERVPVHGDFYAKQVLHHAGEIRLLDFDEAALGDPLSDLGNWCAKLEAAVLLGRLEAARRDELNAALLAGYGRASRTEALHAATALRLLVHAPHFFRAGGADWAENTRAALARAAGLLVVGRNPSNAVAPTAGVVERPTPVDARMPLLELALDVRRVQPLLERALAWPAGTLQLDAAELRRHKPGRRGLIEYAGSRRDADGLVRPFRWLGKLRARGLDERTVRFARALWEQGFARAHPDAISIPEVIGCVPDLHLWLQRVERGQPLTRLLGTAQSLAACRRAAEALHKFQSSPVLPERRHGPREEMEILRRVLAGAATARPDLAAAIQELLAAAEALAAGLPAGAATTIHRDFYPDQLLLDGVRVILLDLDLAAAGDPHLDAGNFLAHLTEHSLRFHGQPQELLDCERAFRECWLALTPHGHPLRLDAWYRLSLARHIGLSTLFPERGHTTEPLLAWCRRLFGLGTAFHHQA